MYFSETICHTVPMHSGLQYVHEVVCVQGGVRARLDIVWLVTRLPKCVCYQSPTNHQATFQRVLDVSLSSHQALQQQQVPWANFLVL